MYVIGDIGNTETKICVYSTQKKIIKKIILKSSLINNSYLKKKFFFIFRKKFPPNLKKYFWICIKLYFNLDKS